MHVPVLYIYASSSLLGCHAGTGPISAVSWYWVRILCSWTGFRVGCSLDKARQLTCTRRRRKRRDEVEVQVGLLCSVLFLQPGTEALRGR